MTRRQLTDEQWTLIEPFLPIGEYGPCPGRLRDQFEGVIWRFRTGAQWREMPDEFGPWPTVYGRFRVWRNAGVFSALLEGLIAAVIPEKKDQAANRTKKGSRGGRSVSHDADPYKERNAVERLINRLKDWRGIATRFDKTPESYLAGLELRASMIWLEDLLQAAN